MIRYSYTQQTNPPAPFAYVRLFSPETGEASAELPAQVDTGADRTVIPWKIVEALRLHPIGETTVEGLAGNQLKMWWCPIGIARRT